MMKVGDLVRMAIPGDRFHGAKGIILRRVISKMYSEGHHYEVQTFDGHILVALEFELELVENDTQIPD